MKRKSSPKQRRQQALFRFKGNVIRTSTLMNYWLNHKEHFSGYEVVRLTKAQQQIQDILDKWEESRKETE